MLAHNPLPTQTYRDLLRAYPKTYGKKQDVHPARWLTYEEAYVALPAACHDGTWTGSRDQLFIRLGLTGLRLSEILGLTWTNYQQSTITCTGKKNRIRTVSPGPTLRKQLAAWKRQYERQLDRPVEPTDPILCPRTKRNETSWSSADKRFVHEIAWGRRLSKSSAQRLLTHRATLAGLGHVAPHDLRRSTAAILHRAKGNDGGHLYDLLDIQQVLDHADPATTQRSYLDQIDADTVKARAGRTLD